MSEFCRKCAEQHGFAPDLTIEQLGIDPGHYSWDLCEGCGYILVANQDGKEVVYRADNPADTLIGRGNRHE
jgi:Pyruvate/2-oxoacid:ferredoxin oxidoreductase delta subunit